MKAKDLESITFSDLKPASHRKSSAEVAQYLKHFEDCIENYDAAFPFSELVFTSEMWYNIKYYEIYK